MNVAALHLLKNRDAKSRAEFFKLDDTRRMGESGQELGGCRSEDTWWCNTCWLATPLATVLSEVSRAVSTAGTAAGIAGLEPGTGALLITGVAVPGAKRRGAFVRFKLDILHTRLSLVSFSLDGFLFLSQVT